MTFEDDYPSLEGNKKVVIGMEDRTLIDVFHIQKNCRDNQRIREALEAAVHGVAGSDEVLIEFQNYVYKELRL